jgi:phosphatidylglycerophosphatase A
MKKSDATTLLNNALSRDYTKIPPIPATVWQNPLQFLAFGFGTGTIPYAPGTFGTLIAIPFYLVLRELPNVAYLVVVLAIIAASIWICDKVTREIKIDDHQGMVLDEIVGYFVTMFAAPHNWPWILWGFLLFRLFDIWKPWPIRQVDARLTGGMGIVLDDVLAGIYSCLLLQALAWIF